MKAKGSEVAGTRRRCRPLRCERAGQVYFVTERATEDRLWLHPVLSCCLQPVNHKARRVCKAFERRADREVGKLVVEANKRLGPFQARLTVATAKLLLKDMVGACLARAQRYCREQGTGEVEVFGFVAMGNHLHLVVRTQGKNLAQFMGYFNSVLASSINYMTGRRGQFFSRRYDAQPILDDASACGRVSYIVDNPRAAGLVKSHDEWPGQMLCFGFGDSDTPTFKYFNRTAWHVAGRPQDIAPFIEDATLTLSPLPHMSDVDRDSYRNTVESWLGELQQEADREPRTGDDKHAPSQRKSRRPRVMGVAKVIAMPIGHRPDHAKRKRRPYAFGARDKVQEHRQAMGIVIAKHQDASGRLRAGDRHVIFPEGTYAPPITIAA